MIRRTFIVQVVDANTGEEDSVRVEAANEADAVDLLTNMGRIVGRAKLAEVRVEELSPKSPPSRMVYAPISLAVAMVLMLFPYSSASQAEPDWVLRRYGNVDGYRFASDNAYGATANATELLLESTRRLETIIVWCTLAVVIASAVHPLSFRKSKTN